MFVLAFLLPNTLGHIAVYKLTIVIGELLVLLVDLKWLDMDVLFLLVEHLQVSVGLRAKTEGSIFSV